MTLQRMATTSALTFRGREEDEYREFFGDFVKSMLDFGGDKDHAACGDFAIVCISFEARASADDVIHFIFMMGFLRISSSRLKYVESGAHRRHAQKFAVQLAA